MPLVASDEFRVADSFDKSLAGLSLRFPSNAPLEEGYDVALSNNFSPQVVPLMAGKTEIQVEIEIYEAEIQVSEINTILDYGRDYFTLQEAKKSSWLNTVSTENTRSASNSFGFNAAPSGPTAEVNRAKQTSELISGQDLRDLGFIQNSPKSIRVKFKDGRRLEGMPIEGYVGWKAKPISLAEPSGVRFDLVVRESWIKFSKVDAGSGSMLGKSINTLLRGKEFQGDKKRELFLDLLRRLAIHGLPHKPGLREAILDSAGRIIAPSSGEETIFGEEIGVPGSIKISEEILQKYVDCDAANAPVVFKAITKALDATISAELQSSPRRTNRSFAPHGTYFSTIDALEYLNSQPVPAVYDIEKLKLEIGDSTYNDLSIFGFFQSSRKSKEARFKKFGGSADVALFRAALGSNWFPVAEQILEANVRIDTATLGTKISDHFDLNWSESSQKRNGQNIKKWVINLSTSLSPPDADDPDFFYVNSFKKRALKKGAVPTITLDMALVFETEKLKGVSYMSTAQRFGLAAGSYTNFRAREPALAKQAENEALKNMPDLFSDED